MNLNSSEVIIVKTIMLYEKIKEETLPMHCSEHLSSKDNY